MTASNQNFDAYVGTAVAPIFTVTDGSGNIIDLSTVQEIEWIAYRDITLAAALTKKKTAGGVTLVSGGSTGKFQVNIGNTDLVGLDGWYFHAAVITDVSGNKSPVEIGFMAVLQPGPI